MKIPDVIELPRPQDFCKGVYNGPNGTHCTMGWWRELLDEEFSATWGLEWTAAADEVGIPLFGYYSISRRNDHPLTTYEQLAKAFELATLRTYDMEIVEEDRDG